MITACGEVLAFAAGTDLQKLPGDLLRLRAIERSLAILGEASKRVPIEVKARNPDVPWRAIAGFRDVLVHDYFGIDVEMLVQVVGSEVPRLQPSLVALCEREGWSPQEEPQAEPPDEAP
jgi:uncharacterized protein with HEPN domain